MKAIHFLAVLLLAPVLLAVPSVSQADLFEPRRLVADAPRPTQPVIDDLPVIEQIASCGPRSCENTSYPAIPTWLAMTLGLTCIALSVNACFQHRRLSAAETEAREAREALHAALSKASTDSANQTKPQDFYGEVWARMSREYGAQQLTSPEDCMQLHGYRFGTDAKKEVRLPLRVHRVAAEQIARIRATIHYPHLSLHEIEESVERDNRDGFASAL